jgi:hypothetical protein
MSNEEQNAAINQRQRESVAVDTTEEALETSDIENTDDHSSEGDENDLAEDYQEEEVSDAKYQVENEGGPGGTFAAIGDHAQLVNINYIVQLTQDARQRIDEREDSDSTEDDFQGNLYQLIGNALASARRNEMSPIKTPSESRSGEAKKSASEKEISQWNEEEIASWYYKLNGYEQCYVQAVAVLHGAFTSEISRRADDLYVFFKMEGERIEVPAQQAGQKPLYNAWRVSLPPSLHDGSSANLHKRTHTLTYRVDGVERLFWHDVDTYGQSVFGLRFLDFLAKELLSKGQHGKDFLDRLEQWSFEGQEECRLLSARALGIFLWCQDVVALRQKAYKWARSRSLLSWRRTAMLLDGAYDINRLNQKSEDSGTLLSVLALLKEWKERGQKLPEATSSQTDIYVKCAAANVYELIGKRFPEIALRELEQLLLSASLEAKNVHLLLAAITSAYVSLSCSGHTYCVLTYLAQMAGQSLLQPVRSPKFRERALHRQQCEARLSVSLNAFFFIAATSLSGVRVDPLTYERPLSDPPVFPDPLGRDMILAGLLEKGAHSWFEQIVVLIAVAIMEKKREYRSTAFDLIHKWMQDFQELAENNLEAPPLSVLKCFLLKLDTTLETWWCNLKKRGKAQAPVRIIYQKQLQQWAKKKGVVSTLAQEVLRQLYHSSSCQM